MRRLKIITVIAAGALALGVAAAVPGPAVADTSVTAYSAALRAVPVNPPSDATTTCTQGLCSLLGSLVGPVLNTLVNPLLTALQTLPQQLVDAVAIGAGTSLQAAQATPHSGAPAVCPGGGWTASVDCYATVNTAATLPGVLQLNLGALTGYTEQNTAPASQPATAVASVTMAKLDLLGINVLGGGVVGSEADCPTASGAAPTARSSMTDVKLLGGALSVTALAGSHTLDVAGATGDLHVTGPLGNTLPVTVSTSGNAITASVGLGLGDLLASLNLPASAVPPNTTSQTTLTVVADTGSSSDDSSASGWGLRVRAWLAIHFTIDLGLATLSVDQPSSMLLDVRVASTTCTSGTGYGGSGTVVIPPALT